MFRSSNIIWLENDSTDNTREKIIRSCESQTFLSDCRKEILIGEDYDDSYEHNRKRIAELKTMEFQQDKSFNRCRRMAHCRNILRDNMVKYDTDYYAILDTDLLGGFSYEGIANSFSYDWDCCASNSLIYINEQRYYYDSWAWRDLNHPNPHSDEEINPRRYERGERPINVMSAFGGLAIYNNKYFPNLKYRYSSTDCDHPTIHIPMSRDGAKIVMNPSQIALYNKTRYVV